MSFIGGTLSLISSSMIKCLDDKDKRYQNKIIKEKEDLNNINVRAGGEMDEEA